MNSNPIKWLSAVIGRKKIYIALLLAVQAVLGVTSVLYAMLLRSVIDNAVKGDHDGFIAYLLGMILLVLGEILLRAAVRFLTEFSHASIENALKDRLFNNLLVRDYADVSATHSAEWLNRLTNDTVVCANGITDILPGIAGMIVKMVGAMIMILAIEPKFAYILIPGGAALIGLTYAFRRVLKRLHKNIQEQDGKLRIFMQERIESMPIVRSYAAEQQSRQTAEDKMNAHKSARMRRNHFSNFCNMGFGAAMNGMYLLGVAYGGFGILHGTVSYGTLTAILQLINQIQAPFANITGFLPKWYAMTASAERLMEVEVYPNDTKEPMSNAQIHDFYENELRSFGFENARFAYKSADENPLVLENISIEVKKGDYVALTGHSGCGKSTMLKLFMCLYRLDGGMRYYTSDTKHELTSEYRRLFAYVPQGNQLMSGTIREVVTFADADRLNDDEKIRKALKIACAEEFVTDLDTVLGEKGQGLSEGQMQRIAIARAIFSDDPILLLDEATSALDENTEKQVLENLRNMTDKTVLIVTHRPKALEICNRILHITESGIVERKNNG